MFQRRAVHVIPQLAPVVLVTEQLPEPVESLARVAADKAPGLGEPVDAGRLQGAQHRKLTVEIVQLVQLLGQLDKVGHDVCPGADVFVLENFLQNEEEDKAT
jgi:hypothetical protein